MRKKIFNSHMQCIAEVLRCISDEYKDRKMFLDIGCGDGTRTVLFKDYGRQVFGIDRLVWLSEAAKRHIVFTEADFMRGRLLFENNAFDIILSFDVIEHLPDPGIMLKEVYRLLKKNGIFIISTPNRQRPFGFFLQLFGFRKFPYYPDKNTIHIDPYAAHTAEYTFFELQKLLENKFKVVRKHKVFYGITGSFGFCHFFGLPFFHNIIFECQKI